MSLAKLEMVNIKNALDALLIKYAAGRFNVITARGQSQHANSVEVMRQVSTYYSGGSFPLSEASVTGPYSHNGTITIDLLVAAASPVDLSALNNPASTAAQLSAALMASASAGARADELFDDLVAVVWNIIMNPANMELGLDYDPNRWISTIQKNDPAPRGSLVLLSGTITMTATALEYPESEVGTAGNAIDLTVELTPDIVNHGLDTAEQGVKEGT